MNKEELEIHTRNFIRDRIIDDALVRYFDQRGKWVGDRVSWPGSVWMAAENRMKYAFLEPCRRVRKNRTGTILLTSLLWREKTPLTMHYSRVDGSILVPSDTTVEAPDLQHVGGHFVTESKQRIYLPSLIDVAGNFDAQATSNVEACQLRHIAGSVKLYRRALPSLETIRGDYVIRWSFEIDAPNLMHIGGSFKPHKCTEIHAPKLASIGKDLITPSTARKLHLPELRSIGGDCLVNSVEEIYAPRLRDVGGWINTQNAADFFDSGIRCGKSWIFNSKAALKYLWRQAAKDAIRGDCTIEI